MSQQLRMQARSIAERYGVDPNIFENMIQAESNFDPKARNKKSGALGLGQITKPTGIQPGYGVTPIDDRLDPIENLRFSAQYLKAMVDEFEGDYPLALAAYNAGPSKVKGEGNKVPDYPETKKYIRKIMSGYGASQVDPRLAAASNMGLQPASNAPLSRPPGIASIVQGGNDGSMAPASRPSQLATGEGGITSATQNQMNRMIEDLFGESKAPMPRPPSLMTIKRRGQTSPLSKMGIPGAGNIAKYSAPGGVAALYNQGKKNRRN